MGARAIAGPACAPAPINQIVVPTFVGPKARRGLANIHVAKSSGALHPSRPRLIAHASIAIPECGYRFRSCTPVSIALVRVKNDLRESSPQGPEIHSSVQISGQILGATCLAPRAGYWPRIRK